jgi:hypothetical protein
MSSAVFEPKTLGPERYKTVAIISDTIATIINTTIYFVNGCKLKVQFNFFKLLQK